MLSKTSRALNSDVLYPSHPTLSCLHPERSQGRTPSSPTFVQGKGFISKYEHRNRDETLYRFVTVQVCYEEWLPRWSGGRNFKK